MNEPEQQFSPELIDQQTERLFSELPRRDRRLIADLYQTYTPAREEQSRSLQRIWSRFVQAQEGQQRTGSIPLSEGDKDVNEVRPHVPVPSSFQRPPQPLPREQHRSLWSRLSGGVAVAVVLILILSWVLLTHVFLVENPPTTSGGSLTLGESAQFNNKVVFLVKSSEGGQYLATISFERYDGHTWSNSSVSSSPLPANKGLVSEASSVHLVTQQITLINPPGELQPYIFGAWQIASVNRPATALIDQTTGSQLAVLLNNGQSFAAGDRYTVQSYVSSAAIATLQTVPLPADAPTNYYKPSILSAYLQLPKNLDPRILAKAKQVTAGATSMYAMAEDLENYLRANFIYDVNIHLPPEAEPVSWLLFDSRHGFCNYFATAMAVMARELGMPARVMVGYTAGIYDAKAHDWVVRDTDAHAWTQIYFARYGWINFEPSPGFPTFTRPL